MIRAVLKLKWFILPIWIVILAVLMLTMPNFTDLVREKGQINVPEGYTSSDAARLTDYMTEGESGYRNFVIVFHSEQALSESQLSEIQQATENMKQNQEAYGLSNIVTYFEYPELKDRLLSEDGTTLLLPVNAQFEGKDVNEVKELMLTTLEPVTSSDFYFTGNPFIEEDNIKSAQNGVQKTEGFTVAIIVVILLIVFRSIVTPFIPLITVALSYLTAHSIVAFLVDGVNFPVSTFTQNFMVAILFGIGTDYCILLLSRFKEELSKNDDVAEAIVTTYMTAGKTVLYSGIAVLVGFTAVGFSQFSLYRSSVANAVSITVLLLALFTIMPFFMAILNKRMFWPARGKLEHKDSVLWNKLGKFSLSRSILSLLIVAVITVPFIISNQDLRSYDALTEIGDDYESVIAFNLIEEAFGPGEALMTNVIFHDENPMDSADHLAVIEKISSEIADLDGVEMVRGVTRPLGEPLEQFKVTNQVEQFNDGLTEAVSGMDQISTGLNDASTQLQSSQPQMDETVAGVEQLIAGTTQVQQGLNSLSSGVLQVQQGLEQGTLGLAEAKTALDTLVGSAQQISTSISQLQDSYSQFSSGIGQLLTQYESIATQLTGVSQTLGGLSQNFSNLISNNSDLASDTDFVTIQTTVQQLQAGTSELAQGIATLNTQLSTIQGGIDQANQGFTPLAEGAAALAGGLQQFNESFAQLQAGFEQAEQGQQNIYNGFSPLTGGLNEVQSGQNQLLTGLQDANNQSLQLAEGLGQSAEGLEQISVGLTEAQTYLENLSSADSGLYIPEEALQDEQFQQLLDAYFTSDRQTFELQVIFDINPYSTEALNLIPVIQDIIESESNNTPLEQAEFGIGGTSAIFSDLSTVSKSDFRQTAIFIFTGLFLILVVMLRSIVAPIYLILGLVLCYFTSLGFTEFIFVNLLGQTGLNWAVPFYAFVILLALGIDYSIFLMSRFTEYKDRPVKEGILLSMTSMGTVIISAALILGGTFAAMYAAGINSLMQIATLVITGLLLYALIILPFFVPVMIKLFGKANWWPFQR